MAARQSKLESEGKGLGKVYFTRLRNVERWNENLAHVQKNRYSSSAILQLACRHYNVGKVSKRRSTSVWRFSHIYFPMAGTRSFSTGLKILLFGRQPRFPVTEPNHNRLREIGASILAIEKTGLMCPLERAVMAIRFNEFMIGTQFHPEADAIGMSLHLQTEEKEDRDREPWL